MVAFEPCLATIGGWRWVRKHHHIYTIPIPYRVADPVANQRRKCHLPSTDDLTRRFENLFIALACWPTLRALATAAVSLQATLLQQRQATGRDAPTRGRVQQRGKVRY